MRITLIILFSFLLSNLSAQQRLTVLTDKGFYSSGEKMGVTIQNNSGGENEIVYLELLDKNSTVIQRITTRSDGRLASAIIDIPLEWKSDWYLLRAFNLWVPNMEIKDMGIHVVPIYSEFDESSSNMEALSPDLTKLGYDFQIRDAEEIYSQGDEVNIRAENTDNEPGTRWEVLVVDQQSFDIMGGLSVLRPHVNPKLSQKKTEGGEAQNSLLYVGFVGKAGDFNPNGLAAIYIAEKLDFTWLSMGEGQVFGLSMEDFKGNMNAQILSIEAFGGVDYPGVEMISPSASFEKIAYNFPALPYPPQIVNYLENARKRRIISDIFNQTQAQEVEKDLRPEDLAFTKADKSYAPEDYIRFNDTRDFINEVATFMRVEKDDKGESFRVMMERNTLAEFPPAMFINGYMFTDPQELFELNLDDIERIDIYRKERTILKQFRTLGRNGVIAIYTKNPKTKPTSGTQSLLQGFQENDSKIESHRYSSGPNLASRLLWDVRPEQNENGDLVCNFKLGDDQGDYVILVNKYTAKEGFQSSRVLKVKAKKP
ncbi:MAG: hypothetical protein R8P61_13550 [Bacteroidia bacterium]|nr:hypothetical protein [Bacteroidia bacterium]